jgi:hypothetical protein
MQLPDMVALFDAEVVEFDIIPIMLRLIKDPFSAGKHTHPNQPSPCAPRAVCAHAFHRSAIVMRGASGSYSETAAGKCRSM